MSAFLDTALDPDVLDRARAGDEAALAAIYRAFEVSVRTLARRIVTPRAAADDVAQDVFVDVITRLHQYDGRGSFAGWVRSIAVNRCLMHLRSPWQRSRCWLEGLQDEWQRAAGSVAADGADTIDLERALAHLGRACTRRRVAA
jgi:RNA polymerase sigma factor (sigma-70 family)